MDVYACLFQYFLSKSIHNMAYKCFLENFSSCPRFLSCCRNEPKMIVPFFALVNFSTILLAIFIVPRVFESSSKLGNSRLKTQITADFKYMNNFENFWQDLSAKGRQFLGHHIYSSFILVIWNLLPVLNMSLPFQIIQFSFPEKSLMVLGWGAGTWCYSMN